MRPIYLCQPAVLSGTIDAGMQGIEIERFCEIFKDTYAQGLSRGFQVGIAGHQQNGNIGIQFDDTPGQCETRNIGQPDIHQGNIDLLAR